MGCQNYDDQFSNIESQITALASQVAGLSQVQSDLTALAGTVNSLQTSVANTVDAALADGLADIDAAVASLEAATESAASSEDVAAIATAVAENQTDLDELLAQSSVYQGSITVNSVSLLNVYHAIGDGLNIVNGSVTIENSAEMHAELDEDGNNKVQALINNIQVTLADFTYTAGTGVTDEMTFNSLTGTRSLTLDQKGGYVVQNLSSATKIILDDDATVDVVDLRGLTTVASLRDDASAASGTFTFSKALELHLTALPRSPSQALSLGVDEGGVIDITALTDVSAAGAAIRLNLTLDGPDTVNITTLTGDKASSSVSLTNVVNATLTGYDGKVYIGEDVQNFTSSGLVDWSVTGNDLVTVNVTGIIDPNLTTDKAGPIVDLSNQGDLTTVTTAGTFATVTLASNGNLVTATIVGTITAAGGIAVTGNSDLTALDVSGATTDKINLDGNSDLETVTIDFTAAKGAATKQEGTIIVNNNESLTSLTIGTNNIDNLTITNNADLALINLAAMTAIGETATAAVTITDNDLNATTSTDDSDGTTNALDGAAGDLGSFVTASGMDTAFAYLTAVAANAASAATVKFDKIDSVVDAEGATATETSDQLDVAILTLTAKVVSIAQSDEILESRAWEVPAGAGSFGITIGSTVVSTDVNSSTANNPTTAITLDANKTLALAQVAAAASITRAASADVTLNAYLGGSPTVDITFFDNVTSTSNGENYSDAAAGSRPGGGANRIVGATTTGTYVTLTVGSLSVSATSFGSVTTSNTDSTAGDAWTAALKAAWDTKYGGSAATSGTMSLVGTATVAGPKITFSAKPGSGRRAHEMAVAISATVSGVTDTVDWRIGTSDGSADNKLQGDGIILVLKELVTDALAGTVLVSGTTRELSSTLLSQVGSEANTATTANIYPTQARGDVVNDEGDVEEVATTATTFNRVPWLAS